MRRSIEARGPSVTASPVNKKRGKEAASKEELKMDNVIGNRQQSRAARTGVAAEPFLECTRRSAGRGRPEFGPCRGTTIRGLHGCFPVFVIKPAVMGACINFQRIRPVTTTELQCPLPVLNIFGNFVSVSEVHCL